MLKTYAKSWTKINNKGGYFEDYNHKIVLTSNSIQIINLTNASKPNAKCEVRTFTTKETISNWREYLGLIKISSFNKLIKIKEIEGFEVCVTSVDATDVYSPFVECIVGEEVSDTSVVAEVIINNNTNETSYLPRKIGGFEVLQDSNIKLTQTRCAYFNDINSFVMINNHVIKATQLPKSTADVDDKVSKTNLSDCKDGNSTSYPKTNEMLELFNTLQTDNSNKIIDKLNKQVIYTLKDQFGAEKIEKLKYTDETESSSNIFSPFVKVRRISKTDDLNIFDVYKAIMNRSIFYGYEESEDKPISTQGMNNFVQYYDKPCTLKYKEKCIQSQMLKIPDDIDYYKPIAQLYIDEEELVDNMLLLEATAWTHFTSTLI